MLQYIATLWLKTDTNFMRYCEHPTQPFLKGISLKRAVEGDFFKESSSFFFKE